MSSPIIKVENLSKQYRLGEVGTGTISHDLNRWWHRIRGKEDPYLRIGESNDRSKKGNSEYVWALQDINFEVQQGEVLGIIGKNGAGKSTLLKILSKVTAPTTGSVKAKGRIASLLEVGTGFHPELTGRENIYLNGTILGMTKREVAAKLDEIVDFAGVERYLDTPVKRYSSGMTVRLGFAVAAHLEPEILIVDEVLAVGDAEFQKKAVGKMQEVSKEGGRTVLFVSHNMGIIKNICAYSLLLKDGQVGFWGGIDEGIKYYLENFSKDELKLNDLSVYQNIELIWKNIDVMQGDISTKNLMSSLPFSIHIQLDINKTLYGFRLFLSLEDQNNNVICKSFFDEENDWGSYIINGDYHINILFPANTLVEGSYIIRILAGIHNVKMFQPEDGILIPITVSETGKIYRKRFPKEFSGLITLPISWEVINTLHK